MQQAARAPAGSPNWRRAATPDPILMPSRKPIYTHQPSLPYGAVSDQQSTVLRSDAAPQQQGERSGKGTSQGRSKNLGADQADWPKNCANVPVST